MADLSVKVCGVEFNNPLIAASGTFGFGMEYSELYPLEKLGGISCKGITLTRRDGNPVPRVAETPSGILNAVGLQNPGVDVFINEDLPWLKKQNTVIIANIAGNTPEDYCAMAERLSETDVDMIELNISCPNVKSGGVQFGTSCESVGAITAAVKKYCKKPLIVKLSPNVTDIASIAQSAEANGADAISMINTLTGMRIDINSRRPIIRNNTGGMSGPAIFPVAVRMVWQVANAVKIPIIGMGGISSWQDAIEMMMANYILEGIYFYSGFMFFYNLSRNGKMSGSAQEIRYINRDENTHLWLFRNIITELQKEQPELFTAESVQALREMMREGVEQEIAWGHYVIGDDIPGLNRQMISDYIRYLGNLRWTSLGYPALYPGFESEPESMEWVSQYADANMVKTDFFEARSTAYAKSTALIDDL